MESYKQTEDLGRDGMQGWVSLLMGIKKGKYCMEHWVWCIYNESWNTEKFFKREKPSLGKSKNISESGIQGDIDLSLNHCFRTFYFTAHDSEQV